MIYLGLWLLVLGSSAAQAASIQQQTQGWCSPAVGQTRGNVTITCQGVDPRALEVLNRELGLTHGQLRLTKDQLEQKTKEANEWARRYHELLQQAESTQDKNIASQAKDLVHTGKLKEADTLLTRSTITMAQYHTIKDGMSYQEVIRILGRPGVEGARTEHPQLTIVIYTWHNPDLSVLTASFTNNRMQGKAQNGLR